MTSLPLPGAKEAELIAKVGTGVMQGLRKAGQLPRWPNTHYGLLELYAILHEWCEMAEQTSQYAQGLALRRHPTADQLDRVTERPLDKVTEPSPHLMNMNIRSGYIASVMRDSESILGGHIPILLRLQSNKKRQAGRRGLRTILRVYCPELLDQFEQATTARIEWVQEHRKNFDHWFGSSRADAEVFQLLDEMDATKTALLVTAEQLREFITTNYPPGRDYNH